MKSIEHINKIREINSSLQSVLNVSLEDIQEKIKSLIKENKDLKKSGNKKSKKTVVFLRHTK